jgi:hypothetical protein
MPHPRTGERRKTRQPLKIDKLPPAVHDAIQRLHNDKTWEEIEALSAEPCGPGELGFVDWDNLSAAARRAFPERRIPHTTLHRWYDLRVAQVHADVMRQAAQAQKITEFFASASAPEADVAVVNAAREQIMSLISEGASARDRLQIAGALTELGHLAQAARGNDIKERKLSADERKIAMLERREAALMRKLEAETEKLAKKASTGQITQDDINHLRERSFGLPPIQSPIKEVQRAA